MASFLPSPRRSEDRNDFPGQRLSDNNRVSPAPRETKKAGVKEHPKVFAHVGLLDSEPTS